MHKTLSAISIRFAMFWVAIFAVAAGCKRDSQPSPAPTASPESKHELIFPEELHVKDDSVNQFITRAIDVCASGDYEGFRLLWSIRQNPPFTKQEFTMALQGGATVTIQQLQKFRTPEGEVVYAVRGRVELKKPGIPKPVRDVILMIVNESDQWRLALAPSNVRKVMKEAEESQDVNNEAAENNNSPPSSYP